MYLVIHICLYSHSNTYNLVYYIKLLTMARRVVNDEVNGKTLSDVAGSNTYWNIMRICDYNLEPLTQNSLWTMDLIRVQSKVIWNNRIISLFSYTMHLFWWYIYYSSLNPNKRLFIRDIFWKLPLIYYIKFVFECFILVFTVVI